MLEESIVIYPHGFQFISCFKRLEIGMWSEFLHLFWDNFLHSCLVHPYIDLDKLLSENKLLSVIFTPYQLVYSYFTSNKSDSLQIDFILPLPHILFLFFSNLSAFLDSLYFYCFHFFALARESLNFSFSNNCFFSFMLNSFVSVFMNMIYILTNSTIFFFLFY